MNIQSHKPRTFSRCLARNSTMVVVTLLLICGPLSYAEEVSPAPSEPLSVSEQVTLAGPIAQYSDARLLESDTLVVDLRLEEEGTLDEQARFAAAGISYINIPTGRAMPSTTGIERFEQILSQHPDQPILIHCSSGNRAGMLWAAHLINQGMNVEDAIQVVSPIANRGPVQQMIRDYASGLTK